jgi:hypothetical protein
MTTIFRPLLVSIFLPLLPAGAQTKKVDWFEEGMRQAMADYKKGDNEAVTAKLRELLKIMEEKNAEMMGDLLPLAFDDWKGESIKNDDLSGFGGGTSLSRNYVNGERQIMVKVIKDSPLVKQFLPLIANEELLKLSNRNTHRVSGETAVMEGDNKLQLAVDGRILVELIGKGVEEKDLVAMARKLDLNALKKMK